MIPSRFIWACVPTLLIALTGCGGDAISRTPVVGEVLYGDEPIPRGTIRFVPIEGTRGPASAATIEDGKFQFDARGGVPVGTHRVEVTGGKPTGKVTITDGIGRIEENVPITPEEYAGVSSPLKIEIRSDDQTPVVIRVPRE